MLYEKDVEFDCVIGYVLVIFPFLFLVKEK